MSLIAPSQNKGGGGKAGARKTENNRIYAHPLPLLFILPHDTARTLSVHRVLGLFGVSGIRVENPHCEGVLDAATRSVWITNSKDAMILWQRGFFGKGDLSRSEPSWYTRQVNTRKAAGKCTLPISDSSNFVLSPLCMKDLTSEEVREKRRKERQQFKIDRARALAEAAAEKEAAFAEGRQASVVAIPSGATWKPQTSAETSLPTSIPEQNTPKTEDIEEDLVEDVEHLQLTTQEAFFLLWNLDCLTILDPTTVSNLPSNALSC